MVFPRCAHAWRAQATHRGLVFVEHLVIAAERDTEDDGRDVLEAVDPLLAFRPLAPDVKQPAGRQGSWGGGRQGPSRWEGVPGQTPGHGEEEGLAPSPSSPRNAALGARRPTQPFVGWGSLHCGLSHPRAVLALRESTTCPHVSRASLRERLTWPGHRLLPVYPSWPLLLLRPTPRNQTYKNVGAGRGFRGLSVQRSPQMAMPPSASV